MKLRIVSFDDEHFGCSTDYFVWMVFTFGSVLLFESKPFPFGDDATHYDHQILLIIHFCSGFLCWGLVYFLINFDG